MMDSGLPSVILPEVAQLRGLNSHPNSIPKATSDTFATGDGTADRPTPELAWAALLHDIETYV